VAVRPGLEFEKPFRVDLFNDVGRVSWNCVPRDP
jgi:hypothetical protein